jgi:5-formyltetrahydrofolate cyclo-ligase
VSRGIPRQPVNSTLDTRHSNPIPVDDWNSIKAWRKARRAELIAARETVAPEQRAAWSERIAASLEQGIPVPAGAVVGFCWPHRSEFDARFVIRRWRDQGATAALPAVVEKAGPLEFRHWWPGAPMEAAVYDIPVPQGTQVLAPDLALVPMNGFDSQGYRLGYGGGYFDRTLAALERRVVAVGIAFEASRLPSIHPQSHDIPMDFVVTEAGIYRAGGKALERLEPAQCIAEVKALMHERILPRRHPPLAEPRAGTYSSPVCYAPEIAPDYFGGSPASKDEG